METIPEYILNKLNYHPPVTNISEILNTDLSSTLYEEHLILDKVLSKYAWILDIVTKDSKKTCCFTKAYGHYVEGTGSVFCPFTDDKVKSTYEQFKNSSDLETLRSLKLRYFTAEEISKLMCFPLEFNFPSDVTRKQKYRLLGNSINVKLVTLLIRIILCDEKC